MLENTPTKIPPLIQLVHYPPPIKRKGGDLRTP